MSKDHIKGFSIISVLLIIVGFVFIFSSVSFGTSMADTWFLEHTEREGIGPDSSQYNIVTKTYINNFVIVGRTLLSTGLLLAILTYFAPLFLRKNKDR